MSRKSVMRGFFDNAEQFVKSIGVYGDPSRVFNIDETWYNEQAEKQQKVVFPRENKMPYKVYGGKTDHTTLTMCISADGRFLPTMFTFKGNVPSNPECHEDGPKDAIYSSSESGHIDTELYTQYVCHLEPFLGPNRPVAIFQDNLSCHDNPELIDFCLEKQIHLFNIPAKSSHIVQPLDKLFGLLKKKIAKTKHEAMLVHQQPMNKSKIPTIVRFAIRSIGQDTVKTAFKETGIFPLDIDAIDDSLLVGDEPGATLNPSNTDSNVSSTPEEPTALIMDVFDENGNSFPCTTPELGNSKTTQTDPIGSLPCSVCIQNDVSIHPAVSAGIVSLDMASVLIPDAATTSQRTPKTNRKRSSTQGRWLTNESEIKRRQEQADEVKKNAEAKRIRKETRKREQQEKMQEKQALKLEKQKKRKENIRLKKAENATKRGSLMDNGSCFTCRKVPKDDELCYCAICDVKFHKKCKKPRVQSFITVCELCSIA